MAFNILLHLGEAYIITASHFLTLNMMIYQPSDLVRAVNVTIGKWRSLNKMA